MTDPRRPVEADDEPEPAADPPDDAGGDPACWSGLVEGDESGVFGDHGY